MEKAMTVGEAVDRHGFCELMLRLADLAIALGRTPVGEWDYRFTSDPSWRVCLNGGVHDTWTPTGAPAIRRFYAYIEHHGWPAGLCNAAGGAGAEAADCRAAAPVGKQDDHVSA